MYPKVKVRQDFEDDHETLKDKKRNPRSPVLGLKAIDFLSIYDSNTVVQKCQVFPDCIARISKICISNPLREIDSVGTNETISDENDKSNMRASCTARISKAYILNPLEEIDSVGTNETISDENDKSNIRASSIPRPRAVLSSPDNDVMIGKNNRRSTDRPSALKNHNRSQQRSPHVVKSMSNDAVNVVTPRKTKESADGQSMQKQKDRSASSAMRQKQTYVQTGKANAFRF